MLATFSRRLPKRWLGWRRIITAHFCAHHFGEKINVRSLFLTTVTLLTALSLSFTANSSDLKATIINDNIPWKAGKVGDEIGEVSTWRRKVEGADVQQFRGEIIIPQPALHVLLTLDNSEDLSDWVFHCQKSDRALNQYVYMEYSGIWPVADRYVTLTNKASIKDGVINIKSTNVPDVVPAPKGMVQISEFNNLFEVTPLPNGNTKIRFTTFVDLSGGLPSWIANMVSKSAPKVTLSEMRDLLESNHWDYSNASIDDLTSSFDPIRDELKNLLSQQLTAAE
tara:strand:+ start:231 stop:1073 length:843 start_codon:yes stop_codon:yes gene_type:complete